MWLINIPERGLCFYFILPNTGPAKAKATVVEGDITDKSAPNAEEHWTTKTIIATQVKNLQMSVFKLAIQ